MLAQPARARLGPGGVQTVEVAVHGGYRPAAIRARAGVPLRVVFQRDDDDACSERVVFSAPRLDRRLAPGATTTVDLPAQPPGEIRFTCGMGRYRGHIELVDRMPSLGVSRLREQVARVGRPLAVALVVWILSLALIGLPAVFVLDLRAAMAVAALALVASLAVCLWAFRGSTRST